MEVPAILTIRFVNMGKSNSRYDIFGTLKKMDLAEAVRNVIRDRKTEKILADPQNPVEYTAEQLNSGDQIVKQAIRDSGWAPFSTLR